MLIKYLGIDFKEILAESSIHILNKWLIHLSNYLQVSNENVNVSIFELNI